jgi:hypothetical protein
MKPVTVDPRAWNIVAGLCVASGCGGRTISADGSADGSTDGSGTDASESAESSTESNTTLETGGPECVTDADCQPGYYCLEGVCEYTFAPDGHLDSYHYGECYADIDCNTLEICDFDYCQQVLSPSACQPPDPVPGLSIPIGSLALSFADVDADGADELVVATASELQVYESGSDMPSTSPRGLDSDSIDAMVGGPFDEMPGEDVMILFADELRLHGSDGVGNFAAPSVSPSAWPDGVGLLAGEFDGAAPADLLIWASSGAGVQLGSGDGVPLSAEVIGSATARSLVDPLGGFVLQHDAFLNFYTAVGVEIGSSQMRGSNFYALTSIAQLGDSFDLSSSSMPGQWTVIEQWGPATGNLGIYWGLLGRVDVMAGGDFDGDARADIALIVDGIVQIQWGVLTDSSCLALYPFAAIAEDLVVGDHDGDGDDEIAVRFDAGNIAVLDGE